MRRMRRSNFFIKQKTAPREWKCPRAASVRCGRCCGSRARVPVGWRDVARRTGAVVALQKLDRVVHVGETPSAHDARLDPRVTRQDPGDELRRSHPADEPRDHDRGQRTLRWRGQRPAHHGDVVLVKLTEHHSTSGQRWMPS